MIKKFFSVIMLFIFLLSAQCVNVGKFLTAKSENSTCTKVFNYADTSGNYSLYMEKGASVRIGKTESTNGLRFSAKITEEEKLALDKKYGAENVTYGMLIAKLDDVQVNGNLSGETVFGDNAVYNWAENGKYTPEEGKTRITNLTISSKNLATDDGDYIVRGSISGILDKNLTVERVARAYVKCHAESEDIYIFSDFKFENARSVVYVADNAVLKNNEMKPESKGWIFDNYIMKAVRNKIAEFESAECGSGKFAEAEAAYEELMLLIDSLSEENYAACFSAAEAKTVNAKIDALYSAKADSCELVKNVSVADVVKPTDGLPDEVISDGVEVAEKDGFYISDTLCYITKSKTGDGWEIPCQGANRDMTLVFPVINFGEYDAVSFELGISGMKCASVSGGEIAADATTEIRLVNEGTKLSCYAGDDKISEISDSDIIYGKKPFSIDFIACGENGHAELGTVKGEKSAYDTTTETKDFNLNNLGMSAVPDCLFGLNNENLRVQMSSDNVSIYLPKNDFRENREVSFDLFFNENIEIVKLGDAVLWVSGQNKRADIKYLSGGNLAVYIDGKQVSVINDFEIISGEKSFAIGLEGNESGVLTVGKISYTKYNRQSVSENVSFNAEKVKRKAFKGKPASFKQGIYATNCGDMIGCETAEIGSGLCMELFKNAEDSAEIYLPPLNFAETSELRFKLATENIGYVTINGNGVMFGGDCCDIIVTYSDNKIKLTTDIQGSDGNTMTINDKSIVAGEVGIMIKINEIADGAKVYVSDLALNGIKTYRKMRVPA